MEGTGPPEPRLALDDRSFTLLAAWRSGHRFVGRQVSTANELELALRDACGAAAELVAGRDYRPYSADVLLEAGEFTTVPRESLPIDSSVLELLRGGAALDHIAPGELAHKQTAFYAVLLGDDPDARTAYIAKHNPGRIGRRGGIISFGHDVLTHVEDPVFIFEPDFDLIIDPRTVFILNSSTYELLFRDAPEVVAAVRGWVGEIALDLPFFGDGADALVARCEQDSRLRRRLFAIRERGHLRGHTVEDIVNEARRLGRDPGRFVRDGALFFDENDPAPLLFLLNEDLFIGGLSQAGFQAQRKSEI